ncbi:MAG: hypothetical protein RSC66_07610, partial [Comamonas sp.]
IFLRMSFIQVLVGTGCLMSSRHRGDRCARLVSSVELCMPIPLHEGKKRASSCVKVSPPQRNDTNAKSEISYAFI